MVAREVATAGAGGGRRPLLVIAHPGHELRLLGWLREARPDVVVLTDGTEGHDGSGVHATRRTLEEAGAHEAPMFAAYSDRQIQRSLLHQDAAIAFEITGNLIDLLQLGHYEMVVADPLEGYDPVHDLCRVLVDIAVGRVARIHGHRLRNCDYELGDAGSEPVDESQAPRELGSEQPQFYPPHMPPFYEARGDEERTAGRGMPLIRHYEHFLPLVQVVARHFDTGSEWAAAITTVDWPARSTSRPRSIS